MINMVSCIVFLPVYWGIFQVVNGDDRAKSSREEYEQAKHNSRSINDLASGQLQERCFEASPFDVIPLVPDTIFCGECISDISCGVGVKNSTAVCTNLVDGSHQCHCPSGYKLYSDGQCKSAPTLKVVGQKNQVLATTFREGRALTAVDATTNKGIPSAADSANCKTTATSATTQIMVDNKCAAFLNPAPATAPTCSNSATATTTSTPGTSGFVTCTGCPTDYVSAYTTDTATAALAGTVTCYPVTQCSATAIAECATVKGAGNLPSLCQAIPLASFVFKGTTLEKAYNCIDDICKAADSKDSNPCNNDGDSSGTCVYVAAGSYTCSCSTGYYFVDGTCRDIDECKESSRCQNGACKNIAGSYLCSCNTGYEVSSDSKSCNDIDECTKGSCKQSGDSAASCLNTAGSYLCFCSSGYTAQSGTCSANSSNGALQTIGNLIGAFFSILFLPIILPFLLFSRLFSGRSGKGLPELSSHQFPLMLEGLSSLKNSVGETQFWENLLKKLEETY